VTAQTKTVSGEVKREIEAFGEANGPSSVSSTMERIADALERLADAAENIGQEIKSAEELHRETTTIIERARNWPDDRRAVRTINVGD
jgi:uncharacterized protein YukE